MSELDCCRDWTFDLQRILRADPARGEALQAVAALQLGDCWIGAGFVRDAVWDERHGYGTRPPGGDVDVVWFAAGVPPDIDRRIEKRLRGLVPGLGWSVKNQARMHLRNGDGPYASVTDAMRHWPETATAVAVRIGEAGSIEVAVPFGLGDLFGLRLRPTPAFSTTKLPVFAARVSTRRWMERYPLLTL